MKIYDIGKNVKLNYIDLAIGGHVIPKDSFGTITGHPYEFEITWKIGDNSVQTTIDYEALNHLEEGGMIEILNDVKVPSEPEFKEGDLVKGLLNYAFIVSSKYNIAEKTYIYRIKYIEYLLTIGEDYMDDVKEEDLVNVDEAIFNIDYCNKEYHMEIKKAESSYQMISKN